MKKIKLSADYCNQVLEMTITVLDEAKFKKECSEINNFLSGHRHRATHHGSHEKAGLALFAAECFQQVAFNNFKDEEWLTKQFDWRADKGIEGYPSIADLGIKINYIESWFIDSDDIQIAESGKGPNNDN